MEIRNNTMLQTSPAFQAKIDKGLMHRLRIESSEISNVMYELVEKQIGRVRGWGDKSSEITTSFNLENCNESLALFNHDLSTSYGAELPQRGNILLSFLNLRKNDVLNAENQLADTVMNNKFDLIAKAIQNKDLTERIAGKANPTDEEFAEAIDKLTDEQVTNFRFGLDKKTPEIGTLIDFAV